MTTGAKFKENGLNLFPSEINRNVSLSSGEARLIHLWARVPAHSNPTIEQLEKL